MSADVQQITGSLITIAAPIAGPFAPLLYAAGTALMISGARQAAKDAERESRRRAREAANSRSIKGNVRGSAEVHFVCFGRVRVGGIIVVLGTARTSPSTLHIGIAHSLAHAGGCETIESVWINDEHIPASDISGDFLTGDAVITNSRYVSNQGSMVSLRHFRGTSTQAADNTTTAAGVKGSGPAAYRRGISWTRFTLERPADDPETFEKAFPTGIPNLSVQLKGNRCYDPRADSTNGGSGTQRHSDVSTWEWSRNSAVVAATYMMMPTSDGGMGVDADKIDWASVAAAANICDETVTNSGSPTVSQPRYRCDIALDTAQPRRENLQAILDTMMGSVVRVGSKYKMYAGAYDAPTFELDESYLRGGIKISTRSPLNELYNAVRITHDNEDQGYRTVEAPPYTNSTYEEQDGGERLWKEETRPGIASTYQAQYVGAVLGQMSRKQKIIEAPCNLKALNIEAWETGTVTIDELGIDGAVYRVVGWEWGANGPQLTLREETSDVWDFSEYRTAVQTEIEPVSTETPQAPQNFTASSSADGVLLTWDGPPPLDAPFVDIYRASGTGSPQVFSLLKAGVLGTEYTDEPSDNATYHYKAQRRNYQGAVSAFTPEDTAVSGSVKVVNNGARLGDERNATSLIGANRTQATIANSPLTGQDGPLGARILVAAHSRVCGFGSVSYNSGTITGLANSTLHYVYADDPDLSGGAVTYSATTDPTDITSSSGRVYIDSVTTPADGGGDTGGDGNTEIP